MKENSHTWKRVHLGVVETNKIKAPHRCVLPWCFSTLQSVSLLKSCWLWSAMLSLQDKVCSISGVIRLEQKRGKENVKVSLYHCLCRKKWYQFKDLEICTPSSTIFNGLPCHWHRTRWSSNSTRLFEVWSSGSWQAHQQSHNTPLWIWLRQQLYHGGMKIGSVLLLNDFSWVRFQNKQHRSFLVHRNPCRALHGRITKFTLSECNGYPSNICLHPAILVRNSNFLFADRDKNSQILQLLLLYHKPLSSMHALECPCIEVLVNCDRYRPM